MTGPPMLDRAEYFRRWADLHGGYDPAVHRPARIWLSAVYAVARRCPAALTATGATVGGLLAAVAVPLLAAARWPLAAAAAVALSAGLDSLDGALAIGRNRATRRGFVLDSVADRVSDTAHVVALWLLGAPGPLAVTAGALTGLLEYVRARAGAAGLSDIAVVTVFERPTRLILAGMLLVGTAVTGAPATLATAGAAGWAALALVALVQLARSVHRDLS